MTTLFSLVYLPQGPFLLPLRIIGVLVLLFFAILFLQSGYDKINDRKGNVDWLTGHFANSILKGQVEGLLTILTIMEMLSGIAALGSAVAVIFLPFEEFAIPFFAVTMCAVTLLALFMGQRIAKDYTGAAGIIPYFIVALLAMVFFAFPIV